MKLALVHDYLIQDGGAEKVVDVMHGLWPQSPIYTLLFDKKKLPAFKGRDIRTSFLKRLPLGTRKYQWYLPLMPTATEHYDLTGYDVVLSSTSAFAKGVITRDGTMHRMTFEQWMT